jgi:hypothetical protein
MTPNFAMVRVDPARGPRIFVPLPLFLLWIPTILLAPFGLVALLVWCVVTEVSFWGSVSTLWGLLCGLTGTDVRVCADGNRVTVRIW